MTQWTFPIPGELAARLQEETIKNVKRMSNGMDLIFRPKEPQVGQTPRELIYRRNKSALYRYGHSSGRRHPVPVLMVPNLGISRPYIFDPSPAAASSSTWSGKDRFLLPGLGVFGDEDSGLTVDECVTQILPVMVRKLLRASQAGR
jgi:polyhydroxyalkanoate synthase